jgi:uncharacterized SAM-binding protein YcdF (DUF218 family)
MLFFLRGFIEALLLPIGISALFSVAGILLRRRWMVALGVAILYTFSTPLVGRLMLGALERSYEAKTIEAAPVADAIVVLNGGILRGTNAHGAQWGESANRYFAGLDLATAGKAKLLVLSAGRQNPGDGSQAAILRQFAISRGLPADRIILTSSVSTTEDEARAVAKLPSIHSVILVTSGFHMPRALLLFQALGLIVEPFPTDQRILDRRPLTAFDFIPGAAALREAEQAIREYEGLAVYRMVMLFRPAQSRH